MKLECNSSLRPAVATTKTDKNGYFFVKAPKTVTTYAFHKCKVSLVSAPPSSGCKKPSNLHGGLMGATLRPEKPFMANKLPFVLYSVGPLAFEPQCHHWLVLASFSHCPPISHYGVDDPWVLLSWRSLRLCLLSYVRWYAAQFTDWSTLCFSI